MSEGDKKFENGTNLIFLKLFFVGKKSGLFQKKKKCSSEFFNQNARER
jgi:hypothetical protein